MAIVGSTVCLKHGAGNPVVAKFAQDMVSAARMEIMGSTDEAVRALFDLMQNASSEAIRLKSAEALLDRANIRAGSELSVVAEVTDSRASDILTERLAKLATAADRRREQAEDAVLALEQAESEDLDEAEEPESAPEPVEGELLGFPLGYRGRLGQLRALDAAPSADES